MLCIRVTISKTYTDHGLFKVPQKTRFSLEMMNLVVMFATIILNISLCVTVPWENNRIITSENRENVFQDKGPWKNEMLKEKENVENDERDRHLAEYEDNLDTFLKAGHNIPEPAWTGRNDDQPRQSIVEPSPREIHEEHDESSLPGAIVGISIAQTIVLLLITFNSIHYWIKGGQSTSHSCFLFLKIKMIKIIFHFSGSGAAQRKEKTALPDDPVTITFVQTNAGSTFRYWQLFLHQILTTLQAGLAFFCYITHEGFFSVTFTLCYMVLCLSMASLVLTYLYSTDTFIFVFMVFVSLFLHRQYPHQVHDT